LSSVDVYRDKLGIPHIYASNLHAQDRFWRWISGATSVPDASGNNTLGPGYLTDSINPCRLLNTGILDN
jgi:hypothetical protein